MRAWCESVFRLRKDAAILACLLATSVAPVAAQQTCDLVRVQFDGCAEVKLPGTLDATVGTGSVSLTSISNTLYEGTAEPFVPDDTAKLLNVDLSIVNVRTACNVQGAYDPGFTGITCRALYKVKCESLWSLKVLANEKVPSFAYKCGPNTFSSCDNDTPPDNQLPLDQGTTVTIAPLARSQKVNLTLPIPDSTTLLEYEIRQKLLQLRGGTAKLKELRALNTVVSTFQSSNPYVAGLHENQAVPVWDIILTIK